MNERLTFVPVPPVFFFQRWNETANRLRDIQFSSYSAFRVTGFACGFFWFKCIEALEESFHEHGKNYEKEKKKKRRKKLGKHSFTVHYTSITQNRGSKIDFVGGNRAWQVVAFDIEGSDRSRVDVTRDSSIVWNLRIMLDILVIKGWERERKQWFLDRSPFHGYFPHFRGRISLEFSLRFSPSIIPTTRPGKSLETLKRSMLFQVVSSVE